MGARRVAPAAIVTRKSVVGWAEVSGGDKDGGTTGMAPLWVVGALELKTRPTTLPLVEQCRAQRRRAHTISLAVQVAVPTSPTCGKLKATKTQTHG